MVITVAEAIRVLRERLEHDVERAYPTFSESRQASLDALAKLVELAKMREDRAVRPIEVAFTHGRQALAELTEMLDWIEKSLGPDSPERETVKSAVNDVGDIVDRWRAEKERWM